MKLRLPGHHEDDLMLSVPRGYRATVRWRPQIGDIVPDFRARGRGGAFRFHPFAEGHWVVLFSHPAAFTPICSTELASLAAHGPEFEARDVRLLNVSADAPEQSAAWLADIEALFGVKISFPTVTDESGALIRIFGMIHRKEDEACAIRKTFVIDPTLRIRAITEYPLVVGRSTDELLRLIDALQAAQIYNVGIPADWHPGDHAVQLPGQAPNLPGAAGTAQRVRPYLTVLDLSPSRAEAADGLNAAPDRATRRHVG